MGNGDGRGRSSVTLERRKEHLGVRREGQADVLTIQDFESERKEVLRSSLTQSGLYRQQNRSQVHLLRMISYGVRRMKKEELPPLAVGDLGAINMRWMKDLLRSS
jgi:hypothetical protein